MNRDDLIRSLIQYAASGKLDPRETQLVLRKLLEDGSPPVSSGALLEELQVRDGPEFQALASHLRASRRKDALAHHGLKLRSQPVPPELRSSLSDLPLDARLGWGTRESTKSRVQTALSVLGDRCFLAEHREKAPGLVVTVEKQYELALAATLQNSAGWDIRSLLQMAAEVEKQSAAGKLDLSKVLPPLQQLLEKRQQEAGEAAERAFSQPEEPLPQGLDGQIFLEKLKARFAQSQTREERRRLLDRACLWPNDQAAAVLLDLALEPWAEDRAGLILSLRFGQPTHTSWDAWRAWLRVQASGKGGVGAGSRVLLQKRPMAMLFLWYSRQPDADRDALSLLEQLVVKRLEPVTMNDFVERWADSISGDEWQALTGSATPPVQIIEDPPTPEVPAVREAVPVAVQRAPAPRPPRVVPPRPPPKPSVWDVHLKPFFLENWYMVAGVAMVLVGSSLLAYYTWNRGWLIRYTLMPALLGAFTSALAWMGGWIERKDAQFKGTAAVLRGAAIGLLPVNFMAVALLAGDPDVTHKALAVPLMSILYFALAGWGLRKWCSAVHPALGLTLGGTLLLQNGLVMLAGARSAVSPEHLLPVIGAGFYLGFFALMAAVVRFSRKILSADLAKEKRVVWFFGAALAVTFVQVFAWVHS